MARKISKLIPARDRFLRSEENSQPCSAHSRASHEPSRQRGSAAGASWPPVQWPFDAAPRRVEGGQAAGQPRPRRMEREAEQEQAEARQAAHEECRCHDVPPCQAATASGISGATAGPPSASSRSGTGNRASARIHSTPAAYSATTMHSTSWPVTLS